MESTIEIEQKNIVDLNVDAVVNAANRKLMPGGGVCGAIFEKAGFDELEKACLKIGECKTGHAVITPGFNLQAKYIIHAVGPIWKGGKENEAELLYSTYRQSLILAKNKDCHSIAFPLISSGIYGYPKKQAWKVALESCNDFINAHIDYQIRVVFAVLSDRSKEMGENAIENFLKINWE